MQAMQVKPNIAHAHDLAYVDMRARQNQAATAKRVELIVYSVFPLCDATKKGMSNLLKVLLPQMSIEEMNEKDDKGRTPLMYSAMNGKHEDCELLLKAGAICNVKDGDWQTILSSIKGKHAEVYKLFQSMIKHSKSKP